jgi:hypothetical protein
MHEATRPGQQAVQEGILAAALWQSSCASNMSHSIAKQLTSYLLLSVLVLQREEVQIDTAGVHARIAAVVAADAVHAPCSVTLSVYFESKCNMCSNLKRLKAAASAFQNATLILCCDR